MTTHAEHDGEADERDVTAFWDDLYGSRERVWSGRPNPVLELEASSMPAGTTLDLGCGEGGDAVWLAAQGWEVTAVDISPVALARGAELAADAGVTDRVQWVHHDLSGSVPEGAFDLVSAQFLQSPVELARAEVLRAAAAAVAPGGSLLVVSHAEAPSWAPPASHQHAFPTPEGDRDALDLSPDDWAVVRCETAERDAEGPDGQRGTLVDAVVLVRRRS